MASDKISYPIYDHREEREWRHLDTMQFKTLLIAEVPRVNGSTHGVKSIKVPWADLKSRFTLLFERFAIDVLLSASNQTKAANLLGLSWDEVHTIFIAVNLNFIQSNRIKFGFAFAACI